MNDRECKREERTRHKYELKRLELEASDAAAHVVGTHDARSKTPKLPQFSDGHDKLDSYLQRFGRFARSSTWRGKKTNGRHT